LRVGGGDELRQNYVKLTRENSAIAEPHSIFYLCLSSRVLLRTGAIKAFNSAGGPLLLHHENTG
jgi:hypothetical protein